MKTFKISVLLIYLLSGATLFSQEETGNSDENLVLNWRLWDLGFSRNDFTVLPNGNHTASLAEYLDPGAILSNPDNGGFSLIEPTVISLHGESVLWTRYRLNSMDISNPADPGKPMIYMPLDLLNQIEIRSALHSYNNDSGFNWSILSPGKMTPLIKISATSFVGGDTWVPAGLMDREPAQAWGAYEKRRSMESSPEVTFGSKFTGINGLPGFVFLESLTHHRDFPLLTGYETGKRETLFLSQNTDDKMNLSMFYQHIYRDHLGIESGNLDKFSLHGDNHSILFQFTPQNPGDQKFSYFLNAGFAYSKYTQNQNTPFVRDMVDEILYGKLTEPKESKSWFVTNHLNFNDLSKVWIFDLSAFNKLRFEGVHEKNLYANNITARTYNGYPYDITYISDNNEHSQYLLHWSPELSLLKEWKDFSLNIRAGGLLESGFSSSKYLITRLDPTASIKLESRHGAKWEFYTGYQHDAIPVSNNELAFLNPDSPSGGRYIWNDNGDGIPTVSETGAIYNHTGGKYHNLSPDTKFPIRDEVFFGVMHNFSRTWRALFSLHGKIFSNMYMAKYDSSLGDAGYTKVNRSDVSSGYLYNRNSSSMGNEIYTLANTGHDAYYISAEVQILKKNNPGDPFFLQVSGGGYYGQAYTIPGNGPDYNDMGRFAESSADPNKQINTVALTDSDRGYVVSMVLGFASGPFSIANTLRYRDGETFGFMRIAPGLTQGPTIIQDMTRARPPNGTPRYTFALTWDVRMRYQISEGDVKTDVTLDIYNLLDSRTELYEYTISDERSRDPIETVTGRTIKVAVNMHW